MRWRPQSLPQPVQDWLVAAAVLALGLAELTAAPPGTLLWGQAGLTLLWSAALPLRRRWPVPVLALIVVLGPTMDLVNAQGGVLSFVAAAIVAAFAVGRQLDPPATWWGPGLTVALPWLVLGVTGGAPSDYFFIALLYGGAWAVGRFVRLREQRVDALTVEAAELRARQDEREQRAVAEERARITRELHDVVSHSLSVITIQTQAVRRRLPAGTPEAEDLEQVEATSRQAMAEMRRLLGAWRASDDPLALAPQPGLDQLPRLLADTRAAGIPVTLRTEGPAVALPPGVDLAAYRIVQEALTNVRKHALGGGDVVLRYGSDRLELEIVNDAAAVSVGEPAGHGLVGMRERVLLYGGTLYAGLGRDGRFEVRACLPLRQGAAR